MLALVFVSLVKIRLKNTDSYKILIYVKLHAAFDEVAEIAK